MKKIHTPVNPVTGHEIRRPDKQRGQESSTKRLIDEWLRDQYSN